MGGAETTNVRARWHSCLVSELKQRSPPMEELMEIAVKLYAKLNMLN